MDDVIRKLDGHINDLLVVMQAAWIEWKHGDGAEAAMQWIENQLDGPGLIPEDDDKWSTDAQAWYSANRSDPFPACWCGKPSCILSEDRGFCCEQHRRDAPQKRSGVN